MLTEAFRQYSEKLLFVVNYRLKKIKSGVQFQDAYHLHILYLVIISFLINRKHHATFFENHELSRAAFKSSKYGKHTHNPQFLQSLWRRANARSVSFETIDGGQFTLSTQLIRLKDHIKVKLTI